MKLNSFARFFRYWGTRKSSTIRRRQPAARPKVQALEDRTLMSVIPAATVTNQRALNQGLWPTAAIDPMNSQKIVEFQIDNYNFDGKSTHFTLDGQYSNDGGQTWFSLPQVFPVADPAIADNVTPNVFTQMSSASAAFDRMDNLYVVFTEHNAAVTSGKVMLEKYSFSGAAPVQTVTDQALYSWFGADAAYNPTIAIDNNVPTFTDPDSTTVGPNLPAVTNTDTMATSLRTSSGQLAPKSVYVAWNTNWTSETSFTQAGGAAAMSGVMIAGSDNGGLSFTTPEYVTGFSGEQGSPQATAPQLLFTQGSNALGYYNTHITTPGGELLVFYEQSPSWNQGNDTNPSTQLTDLMVSTSTPDNGNPNMAPAAGDTFTNSTGGFINDGISAGSGPNISGVTDFPVTVNVDPNFGTLTDMSVTVNMIHPNMDQVSIVLIPPAGSGLPRMTLLENHVNNDGSTNPTGVGITGANLGVLKVTANNATFFHDIGTVFDSSVAVRQLWDKNTNDPHAGYFQPNGPNPFSIYDGATPSQLNGTWTLEVVDHRNSGSPPPFQFLDNWSLNLSSGIKTNGFGTQTIVSRMPFEGAINNVYPNKMGPDNGPGTARVAGAEGAAGMSPGYVVAVDNTLGIHSRYAGRIYVAFVSQNLLDYFPKQPLASDIQLMYSNDGGQSWTDGAVVNDNNPNDGFSTGLRGVWMPSITVDQATGNVVVSYYDTRWDPTQLRSANSLSVSIDGGQTFSPSVFLNEPKTATDMISGGSVTLEPIPGNAPAISNNPFNAAYSNNLGFGDRQALVAWDGHIYPFFTSNLNTVAAGQYQEVMTADVTVAAGPRVISSSEGPVTMTSTFVGEPAPQYAADGHRELTGFTVTFDRPVFIPSFTPNEVSMLYRGPGTPLSMPGTPVAVGQIMPVDPDWSGQMATTFFVQLLNPQSAVGTYSYTVGPQISDRIWSARFDSNQTENLVSNGSFELPAIPPGTSATPVTIPNWQLAAGPSFDIQNQTYGFAADGKQWLELGNASGKRSIYEDIATVPGQTYELTFAFSAAPGTSQASNQMQVIWNGNGVANVSADGTQLSSINWQPYLYMVTATSTVTRLQFTGMGITSAGDTELDNIHLIPVSTNMMDQNSNAVTGEPNYDQFSAPAPVNGVPFQLPYDPATQPLIIPGPYVLPQTPNSQTSGSYVPGQANTTTDNVVLNAGTKAINVRFDRQMNPATFTPASILTMMGPQGPIAGPFTVTPVYATPGATTTDLFQIGFPMQVASGQYSLVLAPSMTDTVKDPVTGRTSAVDTNQNAGLYTLDGYDPTSLALSTKTYSFQSNSKTPALAPGQTVTTTISVPDAFRITQSQTNPIEVQLNIQQPNDPDLTVKLVAPDGTVVQLFSGVGGFGSPSHSNFSNTIFSDYASTPIQQGAPPFDTGPYNPQFPLSQFLNKGAKGVWKLVISNTGSTTGKLLSWSLSLPTVVTGTGLGESVADRITLGFRIFTESPATVTSHQVWTQVGPASQNPTPGTLNGNSSGQVTAIAVDPSDPSGNTVYAAGGSGGVWKTTNFMTNSPNGPTWMPLTDFGPTLDINIASIAVFGRNHDPNQSIIFAATGDGNNKTIGMGLLRSMDGGRTWQVIDGETNFDSAGNVLPVSSSQRDHTFVGLSAYKVVVDPTPLPNGNAVVYVAFAATPTNANGGLYRSNDSGKTWQLVQGGSADDVVLVPDSKDANGNEQILYAHFTNVIGGPAGIYFTTSATTVLAPPPNPKNTNEVGLTPIAIQQANLLRREDDTVGDIPVPVGNPSGINFGTFATHAVMALPALTGNPLVDTLHEGWLFVAVSNADGSFNGLYETKDFGRNWTKVQLGITNSSLATSPLPGWFAPSNDNAGPNVFPTANITSNAGLYSLDIGVDPNNPNIVFVGGSQANITVGAANVAGSLGGTIRVDTTNVLDAYALVGFNNQIDDKGLTQINTFQDGQAGINIRPVPNSNPVVPVSIWGIEPYDNATQGFDFPTETSYLNLLRDPNNPFMAPSTSHYIGVTSFNNSGLGATWSYYDQNLDNSAYQHEMVLTKDPISGHTRLIFGDDNGIFSVVDDGTGQIYQGTTGNPEPSVQRNGNLAITAFLGGAAQPSTLAAQIAGSLFYGMSYQNGFPTSTSDVLSTGNVSWTSAATGDGTAVATDQTGSGTAYEFRWPCCINTPPLTAGDFFDVLYPNQPITSRTTGLLQGNDNPFAPGSQGNWPNQPAQIAPAGDAGIVVGNFAVNPVDPSGIIISNQGGDIFRTFGPSTGYGVQWFEIAQTGQLDSSYASALAFGAPNPGAGPNNLDDFMYVGTVKGDIFVTTTGGGSATAWTNIGGTANGLDGSPVMQIVTSPKRGSHEAYAVTQQGVYYMADSTAANAKWVAISGNLFSLTRAVFNNSKDQLQTLAPGKTNQLAGLNTPAGEVLTTIAADWRFAIPNNPAQPNGPTHPVLYVGGFGGVYRSFDMGKTWTYYPDVKVDGASQEGGYLPNMDITHLTLDLGNIDPTTGLPQTSGGLNMLVASTYGRSTWAIRLNNAPVAKYMVVPNSGPYVTAVSPVTTNLGQTLTGLQVTFSGPIDPATVSRAAVDLLTGPNGLPVRIAGLVDVTPTGANGVDLHNVWQILFASPTTMTGNYHLILGPYITDDSGNPMNQNHNAINGEVPGDEYNGFIRFVSNTPPSITKPADQLIVPGTSSAPFSFSVNDAETGPRSVTVTVASSNEALIGDGQTVNGIAYPNDIVISGTGATRTITITPTAGMQGMAQITLTATDPQGWSVPVTFNVYVDDVPVVAAIPDPASVHMGQSITVPLPATTDADGNPVSFQDPATGDPMVLVTGYSANYELQQKLGLYEYVTANGPTYFQSPYWSNAKFLFSATTGNRYLLMPNGQLLQYVAGAKGVAGLPVVASLDPSVYANPTLLTHAQPPVTPANVSVTISGNNLVIQPPANYVGTFRVTLAATDSTQANPILPTPNGPLTAAFLQQNPFVPRESFLVNFSDSRPTLDPLPDQYVPHAQGSLSVPLHANDSDGDPITFPAQGITIAGYDPAYNLGQQLGLYQFVSPNGPTYFQNALGHNEKSLYSTVNGDRYLITPNGQVWQLVPGVAQTFSNATYYTTLDPSAWVNPALVTSAAAPLAPAGVKATVTGSTLTVTYPTSYTGTFQVSVTATDGALSTTQSFLVHVTDDQPLLNSIPDQTVNPGTSADVTLTVSDTNGDTPTLSATIVGSTPAYDLQQQLGLYEYQGPAGASYFTSTLGQGEKWLFSAINGHPYLLMPNGQLRAFTTGVASTFANTIVVARFTPSFYANPTLLTNPTPPAPVVGTSGGTPSVSLNGNNLTVTVPSDYTGIFRVVVTANDGARKMTQSFLVNATNGTVDDTPVVDAISDQTTDHNLEPLPAISLNLNDNDEAPAFVGVVTARSGPAYDLQQQLGLYAYQGVGGPNYSQSAKWGNGKWLYSAITGGRYLVLPTGEVKEFVPGATNVSQLTHIAYLDPSVYTDPRLLTGSAPLPITGSINNGSLTLTPLSTLTGSFWTTVMATDGIHLTEQHFLTTITNGAPLVGGPPANGNTLPSNLPDVTVANGAAPAPIQLSTYDADGDPVTLQASVRSAGAATATIDPNGVLTVTPTANFAGTFTVYVYASDGVTTTVQSFNVTVTSAEPYLSTLPNGVQTPSFPLQPITLNYGAPSGNPANVMITVSSYNPAAVLQQQLGLYAIQGVSGPNYLVSPYWGYAKWMWSAINGQRYFILPSGQVREWAPGETSVAATTVVTTLDPSYYANPTLLTNPPAPPVQYSLSGNTLTLSPAVGYFGTFWVDVMVTDGLKWTDQRFLVNVTH